MPSLNAMRDMEPPGNDPTRQPLGAPIRPDNKGNAATPVAKPTANPGIWEKADGKLETRLPVPKWGGWADAEMQARDSRGSRQAGLEKWSNPAVEKCAEALYAQNIKEPWASQFQSAFYAAPFPSKRIRGLRADLMIFDDYQEEKPAVEQAPVASNPLMSEDEAYNRFAEEAGRLAASAEPSFQSWKVGQAGSGKSYAISTLAMLESEADAKQLEACKERFRAYLAELEERRRARP